MESGALVCRPELAIKLKELGVKQESYFYWGEEHGSYQITTFKARYSETFSAFTVGELGELMPFNFFTTTKTDLNRSTYLPAWSIAYGRRNHMERADTEANCRALLLIFLIENGVIDIP